MTSVGTFISTAISGVRLSAATFMGLAVALTASPAMFSPVQAGGAVRTVSVETSEYVENGVTYTSTTTTYLINHAGDSAGNAAYYETPAPSEPAIAQFGPFNVIASDHAELVGDTDSYSPGEFRRMMRAYPGIRTLDIVECGGTVDDIANLELARMIRRAGIATHVPAHGSARSGGVELFLAGARRTAEPGAEFIVHSWLDELGREANELPMSDPAHQAYLQYYREVGMAPDHARAFYALTNSVPYDQTRQITLGELAGFGLLN